MLLFVADFGSLGDGRVFLPFLVPPTPDDVTNNEIASVASASLQVIRGCAENRGFLGVNLYDLPLALRGPHNSGFLDVYRHSWHFFVRNL